MKVHGSRGNANAMGASIQAEEVSTEGGSGSVHGGCTESSTEASTEAPTEDCTIFHELPSTPIDVY